MIYKRLLFPFLSLFDPEWIHDVTIQTLALVSQAAILRKALRSFYGYQHQALRQELWGLTFSNPVGLAAGFYKNARAVSAWAALGFGFLEVGTVTALAQPGNPKPRLFRLPGDRALINRMGFNNDGAKIISERLRRFRQGHPNSIPLGVNIGKSPTVDLAEAVDDYLLSFTALWPYADYFAINVSSPNTPGLRQLQEPARLSELLRHLRARNEEMARSTGVSPKPLLVKIAPDLSWDGLEAILEVQERVPFEGIIATNTTLSRQGVHTPTSEEGGLSGRPLKDMATAVVRYVYRHSRGCLPVIGVGGIFSAEDAYEKIKAGARLLQVYTGLVYEGPFLARRIHRGLVSLLRRDGFLNIAQAIGVEAES